MLVAISLLYGKTEIAHVAVLYHVLLPLKTPQPFLFNPRFPAICDELLPIRRFRTDKSSLKIRMDNACRLWRLSAICHGPGTRFFFTARKKSNQAQKRVAFHYQLVQT